MVNFSKTKEKWSEEACRDFGSRVKKFGIELEEVIVRPSGSEMMTSRCCRSL